MQFNAVTTVTQKYIIIKAQVSSNFLAYLKCKVLITVTTQYIINCYLKSQYYAWLLVANWCQNWQARFHPVYTKNTINIKCYNDGIILQGNWTNICLKNCQKVAIHYRMEL